MRDFVHVADVARANVLALERCSAAGRAGTPAYNVCSGRPVSILDVARQVAEAAPVRAAGAGGDGRVPAGRRAPRRRLARAGPRRARLHGRGHARGGPARTSPPPRCAPEVDLTRSCKSRCCDHQRGHHLERPAAGGAPPRQQRQRRGSATGRTAARSARPRPWTSATGPRPRRDAAAATSSSTTSVARSATRATATAEARPESGPAADAAARRGCPSPSSERADGGDAVPVAIDEHRVGLPPREAGQRRSRRRPRARPARRRAAAATSGAATARDREQAEQRQAVGRHHAPAQQQPGQRRTSRPARRRARPVAAHASAANPHAAIAANTASAETARNTAAGLKTRNGAARPSAPLGAEQPQGHQHARRVDAASAHDDERRRQVAAEADPTSPTKKSTAPGGCPATWIGQLSGCGVRDAVDVVAEHRGRRRSTSRAVSRYSLRWRQDPVEAGLPVDQRERQQPGQRGGVRREEQPAPRQPTARHRRTPAASRRAATAGTVPMPTLGVPEAVQRRDGRAVAVRASTPSGAARGSDQAARAATAARRPRPATPSGRARSSAWREPRHGARADRPARPTS